MERVTSAANAAAETVKGAIWGEGTNRDETGVGNTGIGTHRAGNRSMVGDSVTHDDDDSRNQSTMKSVSGQHPSTISDIEAMGSGRGSAGDSGNMPGAFGSDSTGGSSGHGLTGGWDTIGGHDHTTGTSKQSGQDGMLSGITDKVGLGGTGNTSSTTAPGKHPGTTTGRDDNTLTGTVTSGLSNVAAATGLTGGTESDNTCRDTDQSRGQTSTTQPTTGTTTGRNDNPVAGNITSGLSNTAASTGLTSSNKSGTGRDTDRSHENPLSHHHDTTSTHPNDRSMDSSDHKSAPIGHDTTTTHHSDRSPPGAGLSSGITSATAATGSTKNKDITTRHDDDYRTGTTHHDDHHIHHSTGVPTALSSGPGSASPSTSDRTEAYTSDHKHDHPTSGIPGLAHKDHTHDHHTTGVAGIPLGGDHSHTSSTNPFKPNPTHHTHSPTESGDYRSIDAPAGPTGTAISTASAKPNDSAFQDINKGRPGEPPSPHSLTTGLTHRAGDDTTARKSTVGGTQDSTTLTGSAAGGPGAQASPSVGAYPDSSSQPSGLHQDSARPHEEPTGQHVLGAHGNQGQHGLGSGQHTMGDPTGNHGIDTRRKSIPLVEGHPESSGPKTHPNEKLPSGPGTGEGTGEKYVKSTGVVAEGGNFDAAAPGAGREADRLLDEQGIHHDAKSERGTETHDTSPGKPSLGTETARHHTTTGAHDTTSKPSLGEKIKGSSSHFPVIHNSPNFTYRETSPWSPLNACACTA